MSFGKTLVTGADGFIGSHLTEQLVAEGFDVRAFVQYNSFNSWGWLDHIDTEVKKQLEVVSGDIRDPHGVSNAVDGCSTIFHLAALIAIPYSYHSPASYVETNIQGTLNLLEAARDLKVTRFVHTSTSEVYGTAKFVPITEDHPLCAQSPYAATKIGADEMALSYYRSFGLPITILRPFNTYGPRQSARAVIPTLITQMLSGMRQIRLGATSPTRDFNYVADIAKAFVAALERDEAVGKIFNAGSNFEISIAETAQIIAETIKSDAEIVTDEQRFRPANSEVERLWADNSKARELLGWYPEHSGLAGFRRGIEKTVDWFSRPGNLESYKPGSYNI